MPSSGSVGCNWAEKQANTDLFWRQTRENKCEQGFHGAKGLHAVCWWAKEPVEEHMNQENSPVAMAGGIGRHRWPIDIYLYLKIWQFNVLQATAYIGLMLNKH